MTHKLEQHFDRIYELLVVHNWRLKEVAALYGCTSAAVSLLINTRTGSNLKSLRKSYLDELEAGLVRDPRSVVCQKIKRCSHRRCHLHQRCPAYKNYIQRRTS
ncbi:MAG TPA: hypothetical protein ENK06_10560 [Gammaproteobacteria bacterium]|nr:hypothetical protein [Gammaproteobacteria bacterium]